MCFKTKYHTCPICMENKKGFIKCKVCTNTIICSECMMQLCENDQCNKCPVCRQENWKKNLNCTIIIPVKKQNHIKIDIINETKEPIVSSQKKLWLNIYNIILYIYLFIRLILLFISCIIIIWGIGFILTMAFVSIDLNKNYAIYWFPYVISLSYLIPMTCCYFKKE